MEHRSRKQTTYFIFRHNYQEVETDSSKPHQNPEMTNHLRLASWKRQMCTWPCNSCLRSSHPFLLQDYLRTFCQDSKKLEFRPSSSDNVHSNQRTLQTIPSVLLLQQTLRPNIIWAMQQVCSLCISSHCFACYLKQLRSVSASFLWEH